MRFLTLFLALALCAPAFPSGFPTSPPFRLYADTNGQPLNNGYVYFGVAGQNPETNPTPVFWDFALTIPAAQPIRTINGYPARNGTPTNVFAAADVSVTVRNSKLVLVYSIPNSTDLQLASAILASAGGAAFISIVDAGGFYVGANVEAALQEAAQAATIHIADAGGFFTAPKNVEHALQEQITLARLTAAVQQALVPTGTVLDFAGRADVAAPTGWVYAAGTIGDGTSGATRANADTQALFVLWWEATSNTDVVIQDSGGTPTTRSGTAIADFNFHKRLPLPDCRGRVIVTKDNLQGSTANRVTAGGGNFDATVIGKAGGAENQTLSSAQIPAHTHGIAHSHTAAQGTHKHSAPTGGGGNTVQWVDTNQTPVGVQGAAGPPFMFQSSALVAVTAGQETLLASAGTISVSGSDTANSGTGTGGGGSHPNVQPTLILSKIIKLIVPLDFTGAN